MLFFWFQQDALSLHWGALLLAAILVSGVYLDARLGEPSKFHPLVGFGRWSGVLERALNRLPGAPGYILGAIAVVVALSPLVLIIGLLQASASLSLVSACLLQLVILYLCIGWHSLQEHVSDVWRSLATDDLPAAREELGKIVSRNTQVLDADEVAQASIESTLENSSDALFATLFWFLIGGAEAALLHRWVNTLDAMWGYRTERHFYFGWAAARLDDTMAWLPARLTAFSFVLAAGEHRQKALDCWKTQAKYCDSPNGGVVMTAGAGALNRKLSQRADYQGTIKQKPVMGSGMPAGVDDIPRAIRLVKQALLIQLSLMVFCCLSLHYVTGVM